MSEFDYQWKNIPSPLIEYNYQRVKELLKFTGLPEHFFMKKIALDAGCGNGRYTYAMQRLGASVDSIDVSSEAVKACKEVNPKAYHMGLFDLSDVRVYDFILCWGVLHHTPYPHTGFIKLTKLLNPGGTLHIMVYNESTQKKYNTLREGFRLMDMREKIELCEKLDKGRGNIHGWWDALNPKYNHGFSVKGIIKWYEDAGFKNINIKAMPNININGQL
jgi:SAM-dependent methyltransferase